MTERKTVMSPETIFREECLGEVRYVSRSPTQAHDKKLQQKWAVIGYTDGVVTIQRHEWRDVPFLIGEG